MRPPLRLSTLVLASALFLGGCATAERMMNDAMNGAGAPPPATTTVANWGTYVPQRDWQHGRRYTFDCPPNSSRTGVAATYGSGPYSPIGSVCGMGVHAGAITFERGGRVVVEVVRGQDRYVGSERNGMRTHSTNSGRSASLAVVTGG